jgi:hypothetical protein
MNESGFCSLVPLGKLKDQRAAPVALMARIARGRVGT